MDNKVISFRYNNHLIKDKKKEIKKVDNEEGNQFKSRLGFSPENINFNKYEKNNKYKKNINNLDEELSKIYNPKKNEITKQYDKKILENFNKYIDKEDKSNNVLFNYIVNGKIIKFGQILGYLNTDKNTQTKLKKNIPSDLLLYYIVNVLGLKNSDSIFRLYNIVELIYEDFQENKDSELLKERCNAILFLINKNMNNDHKQLIKNTYSYHPNRILEEHFDELSNESKKTFKNLKNK